MSEDDLMVRDPFIVECDILQEWIDFSDRRVLEIGCGDGRVTWCYASVASHVTAIDINPKMIESAIAKQPPHLSARLKFLVGGIEDFMPLTPCPGYDIVLFTRSL